MMNMQDRQVQPQNEIASGLTVRSGLRAGAVSDIGGQLKSWWDGLFSATPAIASTDTSAAPTPTA